MGQWIFHGEYHNNQPGRLYTSLVDVGNRVHTRNDSDEDVCGNAYKQTIAWRALLWSFIIQTLNISESFSWVLTWVTYITQTTSGSF